ncbi:MAG: hypothetical protein BroJett025_02500 [Patescibacteria group bacterium]|nr:MAG: hypothetical protein BroJett025_02500 [Patescibacteria group bacterium]
MTTEFAEKIYSQLKKVPKGKVITYKALAQSIGTKAYQAVGTVMKNNPYAPEVPCHRVVATNGTIGGFKGKKSGKAILEKIGMLQKEGVKTENGKIKNFEKVVYTFNSTCCAEERT